jgi:two-component system KDP operon response regulator KdpE
LRRVLVIGEGPDQAKALAFRLGHLGIEAAPSVGELTLSVRAIFAFKPHLILLDSYSSDNPRELFRFLSDVTDIPIVVRGDSRHQEDLVWYLEQGAADYVSRTVSETVLSARIKAILRRQDKDESRGVIQIGSLEIDTERHQVRKDGDALQLTPTEFRILRVLGENAGRPCDHGMLLERVWGEEFRQCSHYLRLYVGYIRQKIEDDPKRPRFLLTEWGVGYRLVPDQPAPLVPSIRRANAVPA